jgi:hypothetical protein
VPVGAVVLALVPGMVSRDPAAGTMGRIDLPGALAVTAATALLIYGLVSAGDAGWGSPTMIATLAAAAVGYGVFAWVESRVATPLVRLRTLARRPVVSAAVLMLVATGLMLGLFFLTSLYLQRVLQVNALVTGLLFLPVALAVTAGAQLGAHLVGRIGGRGVAVAGLVLTALGAAVLTPAAVAGGAPIGVLPGFLLAAIGIGPVFVVATSTALANVPPDEAGVASGVVNTFHELGGGIGVAVVSTIAAASIAGAGAVADPSGFAGGYLACAVVAGVTAVIAGALVPGGRPPAVAGHGHGHWAGGQ